MHIIYAYVIFIHSLCIISIVYQCKKIFAQSFLLICMYFMHNDICSGFKTLTTLLLLYCVLIFDINSKLLEISSSISRYILSYHLHVILLFPFIYVFFSCSLTLEKKKRVVYVVVAIVRSTLQHFTSGKRLFP